MNDSQRVAKLKIIEEEVLELKSSPLYQYRVENKYVPVIGEGSPSANILFVGEAPGKSEAETGKPFHGKSGKVLDHLLSSIEIPRADVYITSIVKDRPPGNRDPLQNEIDLYGPYLDRQITIIEPKVIATLGRFSMAYIMKKFGLEEKLKPISELHGTAFEAKTSYGTVVIVPLYHPAVAVYNANKIGELRSDFAVLKKWL